MKLKYIVITTLMIAGAGNSFAQPEVGKAVEDYTFNQVDNFPAKQLSLKELRGKWLVLDFYYEGCNANIKNLPLTHEYKEALGDSMTFVMVVQNNMGPINMRADFRVLQQKLKTDFIAVFDSVLAPRWNIWSMPYFVIVDPGGVVRALSDGRNLSIAKLRSLMKGVPLDVATGPRFTSSYKYLDSGGEKSDIFYRAALTRWRHEKPVGLPLDIYLQSPASHPDGLINVGVSVAELYEMAYGIKGDWAAHFVNGTLLYPFASVEVRDPEPFSTDLITGKGMYNFNLKLHPSRSTDRGFIERVMKNELNNIFGYDVTLEEREMPVWRLLEQPGAAAKLATRGGSRLISNSAVGLRLRNASINDLRMMLVHNFTNRENVFLHENELSFYGNIDINLQAVKTDFEAVQKALAKVGLFLRRDTVKMQVIVIRDSDTRPQ